MKDLRIIVSSTPKNPYHADYPKFWSNAIGELHHHGQYDIEDPKELPIELQYAYEKLFPIGYRLQYRYPSPFLCYLVEGAGNNYGFALLREFTSPNHVEMEGTPFYEVAAKAAAIVTNEEWMCLPVKPSVLAFNETGFNECHELFFIFPALTKPEDLTQFIEFITKNHYI